MAQEVFFLIGSQTDYDAKKQAGTLDSNTFYYTTKNGTEGDNFYKGDLKLSNERDLLKVAADVAANGASITTINETLTKLEGEESVSGSIKAIIRSYLNAAEISVADTGGKYDATTVEGVLAEIATKIENASNAGKVTIEASEGGSGHDKYTRHTFYQGVVAGDDAAAKEAKKIGSIDIPKELFGISAQVVEHDNKTWIKFTLNDDSSFEADVTSLIEYVTGADTTEISVAVDASTHVVTATVKKISGTKIIYREADDSDPEHPIAEQSVNAKIAELDAAVGAIDAATDAKIATEIGKLDAEVSIEDAGNTNPLNITITEVDGKLTGVSGSIDDVFDAKGAATTVKSEVTGTSSDTAADLTLNGLSAKAAAAQTAADTAQGEIDSLENYVGTIPSGATATDIVGYVDEKAADARIRWGTF